MRRGAGPPDERAAVSTMSARWMSRTLTSADEEQFDDRTHADAERGEDGAPAMSRDAREHADPGQLPDDHPGLF